MHGPSAAAIASRFAPSRSIAATVASIIPVRAPFQPGGGDYPGRRVGEDHAANALVHAQRKSGRRRHDPGAVAARALESCPVSRDGDGVGRMDLIGNCRARRRDAERGGN